MELFVIRHGIAVPGSMLLADAERLLQWIPAPRFRGDKLRENDVWEVPMCTRSLNAIPFKWTRYESGEGLCSSRSS